MSLLLLTLSACTVPAPAHAELTGGEWSVAISTGSNNGAGISRTNGPTALSSDGAPQTSTQGDCLAGGVYPFKGATPATTTTWNVSQSSTQVPGASQVSATCANGAAPKVFAVTRCDTSGAPACLPMIAASSTAASNVIWGAGVYAVTSKYTDGTAKEVAGTLVIRPNVVSGAASTKRVETWCYNDGFYFPGSAAQPKVGGGTVSNVTLGVAMTNVAAPSPTAPGGATRTPIEDCNWLDGDADAEFTHAVRYNLVPQ